MLYSFFFCHQKTIKSRLHEIIRTSSLSIIFAEFSFKPVYRISHHGCEKFQIYGKLQFLEDVFASQNIDSRYSYPYATTAPANASPLTSIPPISSTVTTLLQVRSSPVRRS